VIAGNRWVVVVTYPDHKGFAPTVLGMKVEAELAHSLLMRTLPIAACSTLIFVL
jgi:hypothetical protein